VIAAPSLVFYLSLGQLGLCTLQVKENKGHELQYDGALVQVDADLIGVRSGWLKVVTSSSTGLVPEAFLELQLPETM
jgi:hypothetical protein